MNNKQHHKGKQLATFGICGVIGGIALLTLQQKILGIICIANGALLAYTGYKKMKTASENKE
ncbi:MAG: hypothetical protein ABJD66_05535 [Cellulophaga sp.]|uniref:hypothetical protein n=1 Tax=unclassified Cellulophaga TaxID=2634405 RepID=UPI000C2CCEC3|nr:MULTISPECIES: hypothetical protein [unclassified Cellulophaga]MDO6490698.1 hypothetical protein [Cellulophaga sp. 2_MG-2023]MDO6494108.1 hypothetical protein [Cellulophaga sp. 3_MG-2023]PKB45040.1 hypothetical protein AX016_3275 [Cellulophaga sp. RHA19]